MNLFFFLFATITVISAIAVISSRNPVHSVLFLILAFVNSAGLFVLAGAEFLAMILLIVYVGAVKMLNLTAEQCALVASHKGDLSAAAQIGMKTIYINRESEYGSFKNELLYQLIHE